MSQQDEGVPRQGTRRRQHDQRQTQDVTAPALSPQAQPIDAFVRPEVPEQTGAGELANALGVASEGVQQAMPYMEEYAESQYERGQMEAMMGQDSPAADSYWRVKAFEQTKGENTAREEYRRETQEFYANNQDLDPQEFQEGLEAITAEYIEGRTDNFVQGFAPVARQAEQEILNDYHQNIMEQQREEERQEIRSLIRGETEMAIDGLVAEEFDDYNSVEDLLDEDVMNYKTFFKQESNQERLRSRLKQVHEAAKERAEAMGMTKQEVSDMFVDYIIRDAVENGVPEILDVLYEEDEDGIALVDTQRVDDIESARVRTEEEIEQRIERAREEAERERELRAEAREEYHRKQKEEQLEQIYLEDWTQLNGLMEMYDENPYEAREQAKELYNERLEDWTELEQNEFQDLVSMAQYMVYQEPEMPDEEIDNDLEVMLEFEKAIGVGELTAEDVMNAREEQLIDHNTAESFITRIAEHDVEQYKERKTASQADETEVRRMINNVMRYDLEQEELDLFVDEGQAAAREEALWNAWNRYQEEHGEYPERDWMIERVNEVIGHTTYEEIIEEGYQVDESKFEGHPDEFESRVTGIHTINELSDEYDDFDELEADMIDAEIDERTGWFFGDDADEVQEEILGRYGLLTRTEMEFFSENPPMRLAKQVADHMDEYDIGIGEALDDVDRELDRHFTEGDEGMSARAKQSFKSYLINQEIANPILQRAGEENLMFNEARRELLHELSEYGIDDDEALIDTVEAYFVRMWNESFE